MIGGKPIGLAFLSTQRIAKMPTELLKQKIRDIPDFPKKGIVFKDITPLLADGKAFRAAIDRIAEHFHDRHIDLVVGVEARGFIVAAALAYRLHAGTTLIRKPGKLPYKTHRTTYALEYGADTLEIHQDAILPNQRILMADDLLATGGTMTAAIDLITRLGGQVVGAAFLVELLSLRGRERFGDREVFSLIQF
jgi:adenine phosphoribosyltransferase